MSDSDSNSDDKIEPRSSHFDFTKVIKRIESIIYLNDLTNDVPKKIDHALRKANWEKLFKLITYCPHRFTLPHLSQTLELFIKHNHLEGAKCIIIHTRLSPEQVNYHCQTAVRENKPEIIRLFVKFLSLVLSSHTKGMVLLYLAREGCADLLCIFFVNTLFEDVEYFEKAMLSAVKTGDSAIIRILFQRNKKEWSEVFLECLVEKTFLYEQDHLLSYILDHQIDLFSNEILQDILIKAYQLNFIKTVNLIGECYSHLITSETRTELLFLAIEYNHTDFMRSLFDTELEPDDRLMAYQAIFMPNEKEAAFLTDKQNNVTYTKPKSDDDIILEEELSQALTFMFSQFTIKEITNFIQEPIEQIHSPKSTCLIAPGGNFMSI